ncbi:hypothetical protein [Bosea sp. (in: a-proteobacteria)]|uniref:hypothetical protein n=1 Tax=Bosea sp. (in: a-proteobacteria) TaxID=1871050 RepID=UPI002B47B746|nr:hypothetical protein [Bosea sp. (in: a-proteobacteria)]WRH60092.1 MAG: hypothetical protein RSE11_10090 [Bosea sp. (in: a-proteobacteria)]
MNKIALITGSDIGSRRAVTVGMAGEGALVAIVHLDKHEDAQETVSLVEARAAKPLRSPATSALL